MLAEAAGRPVLVIQTGFSGSLSSLMNSNGDAYSSLNGVDLVSDTVEALYFMGGRFDGVRADEPEFNIKKDISSARNLFQKWPTDIMMFGFEIGVLPTSVEGFGEGVVLFNGIDVDVGGSNSILSLLAWLLSVIELLTITSLSNIVLLGSTLLGSLYLITTEVALS